MKMNKRLFSLFIFHALLFMLLAGCGYRPSAHYAKDVIGETVSTQVVISMTDPENTVIIKDAMDEAVIMRFRSSLRDRAHAQTHLQIALRSVSFSPLQYNANGYIVSYRTKIVLEVVRKRGAYTKKYVAKGTYDFAIDPNAIISDQQRFEAIKQSSAKALDSFVSQVAAEGARREHAKP
jgi:hypothetical protein